MPAKIALCISGDSLSGVPTKFFHGLDTHLLQPHTPDVYLHTWQHPKISNVVSLYKPKAYLEEPIKAFDEVAPDTQAILQRLYAISKVNELVYLSGRQYQWVLHMDTRTKLTGAIPFMQLEEENIGLPLSKMGKCNMDIALGSMPKMQFYSALFHVLPQVYAIRQEFVLEKLLHQYLVMFDAPWQTLPFHYTK